MNDSESSVSACRALWLAVIGRAIEDASVRQVSDERNPSRGALAPAQARAWLLHGDDDFRLVCELAGVDPATVRRRVRQGVENHGGTR